MKKLITALALLAATATMAQDPLANPHKDKEKPAYIPAAEPEVRAKVAEWQDWKFGMFIHWGTYSQWGIVESWSICPEAYKFCMVRPHDITYWEYVRRYEALKNTFNPVKFDPAKWASAAKYAGMKYLIFTVKHHDGFNMYDTRYSDYKVTDKDCAFSANPKANIAKELFDAFRAEGLKTGAYYSIADWHSDDYWWDYFPPKDRNVNYSPKQFPEKWAALNTFIDNQLNELTDGTYGPLEMLWFDLCGLSEEKGGEWDRYAKTIRGNQPGTMMVARHMNTIYENYRTPEQRIPAEALDYPWESCMTMAGQWSYKPNDQYKPARNILSILVQIVSRGGNLLLNVGPGPDGELDPTAYERLREIGDWMAVNSEGIYGTKAIAPFKEEKIAFTSKGKDVYAFYLADEKETQMPATVTVASFTPADGNSVHLLGYKKALKWKKTAAGTEISIPEALRKSPPCNYVWGFRITTK